MKGVDFIHRDAEKTLNLPGVQVHREHPVGTGDGDEVGHQPGGDGDSRLVLLIGTAIGIIRDYGGDAPCGVPLEGVYDYEQFDQVPVHGRAGRLNQKDIFGPYAREKLGEDVFVGELKHLDFPQLHAQVIGYLFCKFWVSPSAIDC